jgi:hypothetical protein
MMSDRGIEWEHGGGVVAGRVWVESLVWPVVIEMAFVLVKIRLAMSCSSRRSRRLDGCFALGLGGTHRADERHDVAKPQLSGLRRVRVSGKYLH